MKKEIVYTEEYALILSDEIPTKVYYDTYIHQLKHTGGAEYGESSIAKTVVGHLPLTDDAPMLEGVPLLPPLPQGEDMWRTAFKILFPMWDSRDVLEYCEQAQIKAFEIGHNKAKEKYKYTEEDVRRAIEMSKDIKYVTFSIDEIIQSLQQPSRPTHFECEMEITHEGNGTYSTDLMDIGVSNLVPINIPKTTTNSQGQVELVGKYLNL